MGRNKLVKRIVLLLLVTTCFISFFIFFHLYFISASDLHAFPSWDYLQEDTIEQPSDVLDKDPEIVELEKKIDYIIKLYKGDKHPDFGLVLTNDIKSGPIHRNSFKIKHRNKYFDKKDTSQVDKSKSKSVAKLSKHKTAKISFPVKKKSTSIPGILNAHIWEGWCGPRVEDLKRDKHFPLYPSFKTNLSLFFSQWNEAGYGERIFGYLHPPETGNYIFAVSCDDNCEIWLSNSSDPHAVQKIAYVGTLNSPANTKLANFRQYQSQISKQVYLVAGNKYYIEALHKQAAYKDHLLLTWLAPTWQRIRTISSKYISSFISGGLDDYDIEDYALYVPETPAISSDEQIYNNVGNIYYFNRTKYKFGSYDKRFQNVSSNIVEISDFTNILPSIEHKPSYVIDFVPKRYEGVKLIHETSVYPNDNTALTHMYSYEDCLTHRQNIPHLSGLFPENSLRTSIDEENWFSQLTFDKKFEYLLNLYNKKINYLDHNQNFVDTKKSESLEEEDKSEQLSKETLKTESFRFDHLDKSNNNHENGKRIFDSYKDKDYSRQFKIKENMHLGQSTFKVRKLLNFEGNDYEINSTDLKLVETDTADSERLDPSVNQIPDAYVKKKPRIIVKTPKSNQLGNNHRLRTSSVEYESNSYNDVDNEILPKNLFENSVRDKPISIPAFVKSHHDDRNEEEVTPSQFHSDYSNNNQLYNRRGPSLGSKRLSSKIHPMIHHKIYFKEGVFSNGTNSSSPDHYNMGWLYNIFGSAIYHLSQVPERYFLWLYNQHLSDCKTDGNLLLSEEIALNVVSDYMEKVKSKYGAKYVLKDIINVEENHDIINGDRYLIEIDLIVENYEKPLRLSRYVFRPLGSKNLYEIKDFHWNPYATVHIIIPVKDQGRWVRHFINNMEKLYMEKEDPYLNIIIVDFNSTDIDIRKCLEKSKLKRYQVVSLDGPFQRALGVQAGVDAVSNPDDIIFTCDLHLEIPYHLIDSIRKHTIKARMAFAPMVFRLSCGYTPELPFGLWEIQGYGLFAISKFDFDRIGGMNTKEFKTKWGGEDWEFLDRVLEFGLEVERMRIPQFYHYYHSKKRMWVTPKTTLPPMVNMDTL